MIIERDKECLCRRCKRVWYRRLVIFGRETIFMVKDKERDNKKDRVQKVKPFIKEIKA
jgi:hypothetical protein